MMTSMFDQHAAFKHDRDKNRKSHSKRVFKHNCQELIQYALIQDQDLYSSYKIKNTFMIKINVHSSTTRINWNRPSRSRRVFEHEKGLEDQVVHSSTQQ